MSANCTCREPHTPRRIVVTGGPGAGKTALLEVVRRQLCKHVAVLPESASILFSGGFPRRGTHEGRRAAQRAIFHVQRELESMVSEEGAAVALCDRGTIDGLAYWPGPPEEFLEQLGTTREGEVARYAAVVHLRVPDAESGYNHANPVRLETAREAREIDERILEAWSTHPRRHVIESTHDFMDKVAGALAVLRAELPSCCRPGAMPGEVPS